jgi:gag-polyprotein putative aspartyl protease
MQQNRGGSVVKRSLAATVLLTFALGVRTTNLLAIMDGQTNAARVPMKEIGGEEVIQVSMNSTGLYDFILDTGSNVTIMRSELVRKLHLSSGAPMGVVTATGETSGQRLSIESIAVAGLATVSGSQKSSCCNPDGQDSTCDSRSLHFLTSS